MSPEEKEEWRAKVRIYQRKRRMNQTEAQKEEERVKSREQIKQKRQNQSEEQREVELKTAREYIRERRQNQSEEQRELELMTERDNRRERRQNQSEEEKKTEQAKSRQHSYERRIHQIEENYVSQIAIERNSFIPLFTSKDVQNIDLTRNLNIENSSKQCLQKLSRTLLQPNELGYKNDSCIHQSLVCVVCDQFIVGTQLFHWIKVEILKFHSNILSPSYFYKEGMNPILKSQYRIDHPQTYYYHPEQEEMYCKMHLCVANVVLKSYHNRKERYVLPNSLLAMVLPLVFYQRRYLGVLHQSLIIWLHL